MPSPTSSSDELPFGISEDLVQSPAHKAAGISETTFDGLLATPLKLHEDLKEGCGGQLWPAGMVLSKYMLRQHRDTLKGKSIVELGAGGGLVGLAVAMGCETDEPVWITDQLPMFALMRRNVELNGLEGRAKAAIYDWGSAVPDGLPNSPDVILAADCVYFEPAFPLLQQTLRDLIGENTTCYFCFKKRRRADLQFMKAARKMFNVEEVEDPDREIYGKQSIFLYKFTKKA
ncbi:hypothetical protein EJ05DRAFT_509509 [Pseudovirgaria hyperparasitica]|uniref:Protein-lysine N-methyltransferase EFM6 n=1 Tax=Pseudovirgaria hyperparasitica TaxID=470096 RepID=A0A6A6WD84_9PEZI|nr:uncharacterized protein EJ05DRAFT_509509 [Pseudovirgaria hyperparasitica]KAF2759816.1 hypothetical protein EJ05DRAFT_509509 [Pseudovirgaria hyperparasitica]